MEAGDQMKRLLAVAALAVGCLSAAEMVTVTRGTLTSSWAKVSHDKRFGYGLPGSPSPMADGLEVHLFDSDTSVRSVRVSIRYESDSAVGTQTKTVQLNDGAALLIFDIPSASAKITSFIAEEQTAKSSTEFIQ